jgi:hypothetical protein
VRRAALLLAALALAGCETTAEKSAKLERAAKLAAAKRPAGERTPTFTRPSRYVRVLGATLLHSSEGAAVAVTLRNDSPHVLKQVPIAIALKDASGRTVFQNDVAGSEPALVTVPSMPARGELTWVDDQLPKGLGASVSARVGEASAIAGAAPAIAVTGASVGEEASNGLGASGTVSNHSRTMQLHLVVFAMASRGGHIVAAGRAVLPELAAGASAPFHIFFIGDPRGAQLRVSAPPATVP